MTMSVPTVKVKHDASPGGHIVINADEFDSTVHELFEPAPAPLVPTLPPLPPGPKDPLADLGDDWKNKDSGDLRKLAAAVSGRAVENKAQAIAVIEAALAARPQ